MSKQSGESLVRLEKESFDDLHDDEIEHMYQMAVKYQHRVETNVMPLSEQTKAIMFQHLREFHQCCDIYRGRWLTMLSDEHDKKLRDAKNKRD